MIRACKRPCPECPWRRDAPIGNFPPEAFVKLAHTAYDMDRGVFQCHDTTDGSPLACAGFLERGADDNLTVRLSYMDGDFDRRDRSGGEALYDDFREMAVANGVDPDDPVLAPCRSPR